jgi:ATP-binding cassette subfamily F protein 3
LEDYRNWLNAGRRSEGTAADQRTGGAAERREQRRREAEQRNQLATKRRPLEKRLRVVEERLEQLNADKAELATVLADPALYEESNKPRLKALLLRQGQLEGELENVEAEWLTLQEALEALLA